MSEREEIGGFLKQFGFGIIEKSDVPDYIKFMNEKEQEPTDKPDEQVEPINPPEGVAPSSCEMSKETPNVTCVPTH